MYDAVEGNGYHVEVLSICLQLCPSGEYPIGVYGTAKRVWAGMPVLGGIMHEL